MDHYGTPRLFERRSYNPTAKGPGSFCFPDGRTVSTLPNTGRFRKACARPLDEYAAIERHRSGASLKILATSITLETRPAAAS
jgi:hypothetical protein